MRDVRDSGRGLAGNVPPLWQEIQRIPRASDVSVSQHFGRRYRGYLVRQTFRCPSTLGGDTEDYMCVRRFGVPAEFQTGILPVSRQKRCFLSHLAQFICHRTP